MNVLRTILFAILMSTIYSNLFCQTNIVTYAGNSGKETFYDVLQLSNGSFLVCGYAENLDWIDNNIPRQVLSYLGNIPNSQSTNVYGFILQLSSDLKTILCVVHFPKSAVEDVRFMKTNSLPYQQTGEIYISCNTADTDANNGGYILAKLNNNFVNGIPTALNWFVPVWAKSYAKTYHPWDITSNGYVYYVSGEAHGYDWSAMYCLDNQGKRKVVNNWRTHWLQNGQEWKGTPATAYPNGGIDSVKYSGIAFKIWGRCELRSWNQQDFSLVQNDGNGGTKIGKWPADFLFNSPCDPTSPTATSPGYNGYSPESCCPVWGASTVVVDRRNNDVYLGMNFKSYYNPLNSPDFEPAVIAFDSSGSLKWWSRLYHEITPAGDTVGSVPDQYVDALAIDYSNNLLVVAARCHGNNIENFWKGNAIAQNPTASGFQNQFTGSSGNNHISWLGKLRLTNGSLTNASFVAELAEGTGGLGTPHPDPNLDGWPNPNSGWPNVNTTYITKNNIKISSNGDVCILGTGRRTITTKNAHQKMVKPYWGGLSCWNSFVRMYNTDLQYPKYSSLIVGQWDTTTQSGGDNTEMFGIYKTAKGIVAVGKHKSNAFNTAIGNPIPIANIPNWGKTLPENESAILVFYTTDSLYNNGDSITAPSNSMDITSINNNRYSIYPNPASKSINILFFNQDLNQITWHYNIYNSLGQLMDSGEIIDSNINTEKLHRGLYYIDFYNASYKFVEKIRIE